MRIMGCFFFAFPCAKVPFMKDRQSTVGGPCGVPIRAFDEIACACCLWIVRRGPPEQVTDRQQIETSETNFPSQRTSGRFLAARSNAILTACSQLFFWIVRISVIQTRGNMRRHELGIAISLFLDNLYELEFPNPGHTLSVCSQRRFIANRFSDAQSFILLLRILVRVSKNKFQSLDWGILQCARAIHGFINEAEDHWIIGGSPVVTSANQTVRFVNASHEKPSRKIQRFLCFSGLTHWSSFGI